MIKNEENVIKIKSVLRKYLLGDDNLANKQKFMALGFNESNIKSYTSLSQPTLPSLDTFPLICDAFGISMNELFGLNETKDDKEYLEAKRLYAAYKNHPEHQESINLLLGIKKDN